jgi:uncharacterized protein YchJ
MLWSFMETVEGNEKHPPLTLMMRARVTVYVLRHGVYLLSTCTKNYAPSRTRESDTCSRHSMWLEISGREALTCQINYRRECCRLKAPSLNCSPL